MNETVHESPFGLNDSPYVKFIHHIYRNSVQQTERKLLVLHTSNASLVRTLYNTCNPATHTRGHAFKLYKRMRTQVQSCIFL